MYFFNKKNIYIYFIPNPNKTEIIIILVKNVVGPSYNIINNKNIILCRERENRIFPCRSR